jgi:WhiB family redox-sensing transcriptional regulator
MMHQQCLSRLIRSLAMALVEPLTTGEVRWLMSSELGEPDPRTALDSLLHPPAWHSRAACRGMGADVFFPEKGAVGLRKMASAREVCASCPVRPECLSFALDTDGITPGVWAGTSERERRRMHSRR